MTCNLSSPFRSVIHSFINIEKVRNNKVNNMFTDSAYYEWISSQNDSQINYHNFTLAACCKN